MPRTIRIHTRRICLISVAIILLGLIGVFIISSYDGRSETERVSDCLAARGYVIQVVHDDGKEPIGGDEGLLGPLGDYQARPPADSINVSVPRHAVATITVQSGGSQVSVLDPTRAHAVNGCAG
jgi:hypothetical protein